MGMRQSPANAVALGDGHGLQRSQGIDSAGADQDSRWITGPWEAFFVAECGCQHSTGSIRAAVDFGALTVDHYTGGEPLLDQRLRALECPTDGIAAGAEAKGSDVAATLHVDQPATQPREPIDDAIRSRSLEERQADEVRLLRDGGPPQSRSRGPNDLTFSFHGVGQGAPQRAYIVEAALWLFG